MIVELFEENNYWAFKDTNGISCVTPMSINGATTFPVEVEIKNTAKDKLKQVIKLKEAGFTADEILELIKEI